MLISFVSKKVSEDREKVRNQSDGEYSVALLKFDHYQAELMETTVKQEWATVSHRNYVNMMLIQCTGVMISAIKYK